MVFSSVIFLFCFFPLTLACYWPVRNLPTFRNVVLLGMSLLFYFWGETLYTLVMLLYIGANFIAARLIERSQGRGGTGRGWLSAILVFDLALLLYFKYWGFLLANLLAVVGSSPATMMTSVHLPIGISFFAFQSISYVLDVYRRDVPASRRLLDYAMYIAFFPQLIAGPIVRYIDVARQVRAHAMRSVAFAHGFARFVLGLAKKVLIANPLGSVADQIFAVPAAELTSSLAWMGIVCYALQIYFDFSGYSDMAIGIGRVFGFRFLENFRFPYIARSIRDFWHRWHISLSSWFRDYLFIPLGGSRCSPWRNRLNLLTVFVLCGLWHGASWSFVVWGLWHGLFLVFERGAWGRLIDRAWRPLRHIYVLLVVLGGWVFFRAPDLTYALGYLSALGGIAAGDGVRHSIEAFWTAEHVATIVLGMVCATELVDIMRRRFWAWLRGVCRRCRLRPVSARACYELVRALVSLTLLVWCSAVLASGTHNPFIYFRF